jgi:hypothetical protein
MDLVSACISSSEAVAATGRSASVTASSSSSLKRNAEVVNLVVDDDDLEDTGAEPARAKGGCSEKRDAEVVNLVDDDDLEDNGAEPARAKGGCSDDADLKVALALSTSSIDLGSLHQEKLDRKKQKTSNDFYSAFRLLKTQELGHQFNSGKYYAWLDDVIEGEPDWLVVINFMICATWLETACAKITNKIAKVLIICGQNGLQGLSSLVCNLLVILLLKIPSIDCFKVSKITHAHTRISNFTIP